jgi:hypothetical protein
MLIPAATASVDCWISTDNTTWQQINNTNVEGCIDENAKMGTVENLHCDTLYYIKCTDGTQPFGYRSFTTESCGVDEMEIAFVMAVGILAFFFLYFAFQLGQDHFFLKLFLIFMALVSIIAIPSALLATQEGNALDIMTKIVTWTFRIFITYFCIFLFWHWVQKSEKFMDLLKKIGLAK